ncbi:unnamed protein product [Rotaria sp. Silwood1]|nr:unnamed protein product [Rotaria sp. Silwood1]
MLFNACAQLRNERALKIKNSFLNQMSKLFNSTNHVVNSFLNILIKFRDISSAENVFVQMKTKEIITCGIIMQEGKVGYVGKALNIFDHVEKPNIMIYTAMINSFGLNGMGHEAVDLYRRMPIDIHDEVTYICILNACSHSGLIDKAHSIYNNIKVKTERITTAMVDCMSRMFMFDEAQQLIDNFELSHPPGFAMYSKYFDNCFGSYNK